jgi:hypothetical protein
VEKLIEDWTFVQGNNSFTGGYSSTAVFELLHGRHTKVKIRFNTVNVGAIDIEGDKVFDYVG